MANTYGCRSCGIVFTNTRLICSSTPTLDSSKCCITRTDNVGQERVPLEIGSVQSAPNAIVFAVCFTTSNFDFKYISSQTQWIYLFS